MKSTLHHCIMYFFPGVSLRVGSQPKSPASYFHLIVPVMMMQVLQLLKYHRKKLLKNPFPSFKSQITGYFNSFRRVNRFHNRSLLDVGAIVVERLGHFHCWNEHFPAICVIWRLHRRSRRCWGQENLINRAAALWKDRKRSRKFPLPSQLQQKERVLPPNLEHEEE